MTVKEAAKRWNLSERRVAALCRSGRIPGARKVGRVWSIPSDAANPDAKARTNARDGRLPLPVGVSDYRLASTEYYFVDKTEMIADFLDERPVATLFTRPRRFGKSLNLSMPRAFFEKTEEDASVYFRGRKIWKRGAKYRKYMGKYPVVFLAFKDVKFDSWSEAFSAIRDLVAKEARRFPELWTSAALDEYDREIYARLARRTRPRWRPRSPI